ncbi:hypothetical protein HYALB_00011361 [Hymenoscyphus albidus]|uniref:Biogenesis of lysosome-related organelles complex 1 subunit 1 n=1 Tax=Hymenoscyphus albidus TaxID=595503 RepID=A0A9N9LRN4_9HELO|nr:hypothetical protein HYALB_00011361 [Hymenoscyphus albidus]
MSAAASTSAGPSMSRSTNPSAAPSQHSVTPSNAPSNSKSLTALSATLPHNSSSLPHSPETMRQIQESRAALLAQMNSVGQSATASIQERAQTLHSNFQQLGKQEKELAKAVDGLKKESGKLERVAKEGSRRVKELGNVQNWAEVLERDFLVLGETIRLANGGSDWSGSGSEESWSSYSGSEDGRDDGEEGRRGVEEVGNRTLDGEGDVAMEGVLTGGEGVAKSSGVDTQVDVVENEGKGNDDADIAESVHTREGTVSTGMQIDNIGGSSTATTGSRGTETTQQSGSSSIHTTQSAMG